MQDGNVIKVKSITMARIRAKDLLINTLSKELEIERNEKNELNKTINEQNSHMMLQSDELKQLNIEKETLTSQLTNKIEDIGKDLL